VLLTDLAKLIEAIFEFAALEHHIIPVVHTLQGSLRAVPIGTSQ
jgi:hypothetical protein